MSKCSFSYSDGDAIGFIKKRSKVIYVNRDGKKEETFDGEVLENIISNYIQNMNVRINFKQIEELKKSLLNQEEPENEILRKLYKIANLKINDKKEREIMIKDADIEPIINPNVERQVFYVSGMSGSGKSTYVNKIINSYTKFFKNNKVYLFSNKEEDESYTNKNIIRVKLDEELIHEPIELDEIKNSMVIFDDIEGVPNKKIMNELDRLRDVILQQGRSYKVYFCYVSHLANNYKQTRTILNECHSITIFPAMTTTYSLKYLLEKYFGFGKDDIKKLLSLESRWITIFKLPCLFVLHENGCYFLN